MEPKVAEIPRLFRFCCVAGALLLASTPLLDGWSARAIGRLGPVLPTARRSPRELNWAVSAEIIGSGHSAEKPASRFKARSTSDIIFLETPSLSFQKLRHSSER